MTVLEHLDPDTLRHLAAAIEGRDPKMIARHQLTDEGIEELANIFLRGTIPTIGFWKRYRKEAS